MTELFRDDETRLAAMRAALAVPNTGSELRADFPHIDLDLGQDRMRLATDAVYRREYAALHPDLHDETVTASRGLLGALRRNRKPTPPRVEGNITTNLCDPYTADLTQITWRDITRGEPGTITVADLSVVSNDSRRLVFGPRQRLVIDAASGVVTSAAVSYRPNIFTDDERPINGANLFEWGNIIERSKRIDPIVLKDTAVYGRNYTADDVFAIIDRRMGPDWADQRPA